MLEEGNLQLQEHKMEINVWSQACMHLLARDIRKTQTIMTLVQFLTINVSCTSVSWKRSTSNGPPLSCLMWKMSSPYILNGLRFLHYCLFALKAQGSSLLLFYKRLLILSFNHPKHLDKLKHQFPTIKFNIAKKENLLCHEMQLCVRKPVVSKNKYLCLKMIFVYFILRKNPYKLQRLKQTILLSNCNWTF